MVVADQPEIGFLTWLFNTFHRLIRTHALSFSLKTSRTVVQVFCRFVIPRSGLLGESRDKFVKVVEPNRTWEE